MKKIFLALSVLLVSAIGYAQQTAVYSLKEFNKLRVWGEFKVFLVKGDSLNAKVETQGIPASDIALDVNGNTLEVKLKGKLYDRVNATVYLTYRELREISVSAAAAVSLQDTLKATNISININTSSEFDGAVLAETADLTVGQGSILRIRGSVSSYEAKVNTGGVLTAIDLIALKTYVKVNTGASAKVYASKVLEANVSTGGSLTYTGSPEQKKIKTLVGATIIEQ
ncbi:head GIN domain-containing protein [Tenuifilum osseticum]|uniref:head GIN domain-containing protein n=1 Tax=Tenuifilum osseticum TaxID=3374723 RepID=UPI0034E57A88